MGPQPLGILVLADVSGVRDGLTPRLEALPVEKLEMAILIKDGNGFVANLVQSLRRAEENVARS